MRSKYCQASACTVSQEWATYERQRRIILTSSLIITARLAVQTPIGKCGLSYTKTELAEMPKQTSPFCLALVSALSIYSSSSALAQALQNGGFSKDVIEWQKECVRRNSYVRTQRSEPLARFKMKIEMPEWADFLLDHGSSDTSIQIADIHGIALKRCNEMATRLHNLQLPGSSFTSITINSQTRLPTADDRFLDAVTVLGEKSPIYDDGIVIWTSFLNPYSKQRTTITSFDVGLNEFKKFLDRIQPY